MLRPLEWAGVFCRTVVGSLRIRLARIQEAFSQHPAMLSAGHCLTCQTGTFRKDVPSTARHSTLTTQRPFRCGTETSKKGPTCWLHQPAPIHLLTTWKLFRGRCRTLNADESTNNKQQLTLRRSGSAQLALIRKGEQAAWKASKRSSETKVKSANALSLELGSLRLRRTSAA